MAFPGNIENQVNKPPGAKMIGGPKSRHADHWEEMPGGELLWGIRL